MKTAKTIILLLVAAAALCSVSCSKEKVNEALSMEKLVGTYDYTVTTTTVTGEGAAGASKTDTQSGTLVITADGNYLVHLSGWIAETGMLDPAQATLSVASVSRNDGSVMLDYLFEPTKVSLTKEELVIRFKAEGWKLEDHLPKEKMTASGTLTAKKKK